VPSRIRDRTANTRKFVGHTILVFGKSRLVGILGASEFMRHGLPMPVVLAMEVVMTAAEFVMHIPVIVVVISIPAAIVVPMP